MDDEKMLEEIKAISKVNKIHICKKCGKRLNSMEEIGEHVKLEEHYEFEIPGVKGTLAVL